MNFSIRGENIEVTPAIREYVQKKVAKVERHLNQTNDTKVHVNLRFNHDKTAKVEITISLPHFILRVEETNMDMYAAIDLIVDKLERQVRKHKTKVNRKFHDKVRMAAPFTADLTEGGQKEEELEVVRTKQFDLKPMDSDEAILQMNMIGHSFYLYTDADTNRTNVVYKRRDGRYGLIEAR